MLLPIRLAHESLPTCILAICRAGLSLPGSSGIVSHVTTFTAQDRRRSD